MAAETQKMINRVKRSQNPMFKDGRPDRTLRIFQKVSDSNQFKRPTKHKYNFEEGYIDLKSANEGDSTSIMKKMK
jgi:hypothetical protein